MEVLIKQEEYLECVRAAKNMWCSSKPGIYGRGLLNTPTDPTRTERMGRLGEKALSLYLNLKPDFEYKELGDAGDLVFGLNKVDIKTASRDYGKLLVQAENEFGYKTPLKSDYYVAAVILKDNGIEALVKLVGWCTKEEVLNSGIHPAIKGKHKNHVIPYNKLKTMNTFVDVFLK